MQQLDQTLWEDQLPFPLISLGDKLPQLFTGKFGNLYNCLYDAAGNLVLRPGFRTEWALPDNGPVMGVFESITLGLSIGVSNANVYALLPNNAITTLGSGDLHIGTPVSFDEDDTNVYFANGLQLGYTDGVTLNVATGPGAPQNPSHVVVLNNYVITNDLNGMGNRGVFKWILGSNPNGEWGATDFATADSSSDAIVAIHKIGRLGLLAIFGNNSLELWEPSANTPFKPVQGGKLRFGTNAPYSISALDGVIGDLIFLDQVFNIIIQTGLTATIVSDAMQGFLSKRRNSNGIVGFTAEVRGELCYVLQLPAELSITGEELPAATVVYNIKSQSFSFWYTLDTVTAARLPFEGVCSCFESKNNRRLIGLRIPGKIAVMSQDFSTDDDKSIEYTVQTADISHGTIKPKFSAAVCLIARSGDGKPSDPNGTPATARFRYRDDGNANWSEYIDIPLGTRGNMESIHWERGLGTYTLRQWEFSCSEKIPVMFGSIHEVFEFGV